MNLSNKSWNIIGGIVGTIIIIAIIALVVWWEVYKYSDCKKVGHSTPYCIMKVNK